jgi:hypothetical protein
MWDCLYPKCSLMTQKCAFWKSSPKPLVGNRNDFWEAEFDKPTKINIIEIPWKDKMAPSAFNVFYTTSKGGKLIQATETKTIYEHLDTTGKIMSKDSIPPQSVVVFDNPIFAQRIRINLINPITNNMFAIDKVRFHKKRSTTVIKNSLLDPSQSYCFYVNTDKILDGTRVDAYPCVDAISLTNNNELFVHNTNDSVIHVVGSKFCLGFDAQNFIALRQCNVLKPAFRLNMIDDRLKFIGYNDKCITIDNSKKQSSSFVTPVTNIIVTTQADDMTYKKENIQRKFLFNNF